MDFSEGFLHDIASVLEYCMENNTDSIELEFEINGKKLNIDMTFSVSEVE